MASSFPGPHRRRNAEHNVFQRLAQFDPTESRHRKHARLAKQLMARQDTSITSSTSTTSSSTTTSSTTTSSTTTSTSSSSTTSSTTTSSTTSSSTHSTSESTSTSSHTHTTKSSTRSHSRSSTRRSSSTLSSHSRTHSTSSRVSRSISSSHTTVASSATLSSIATVPPPAPSTTLTSTITHVNSSTTLGILNTSPAGKKGFSTNQGGIIGVAVGTGAFLVLFATLLFFLCKRIRYRKAPPPLPPQSGILEEEDHGHDTYHGPYNEVLAGLHEGHPMEDSTSGEGELASSNGHSSSSNQHSSSMGHGQIPASGIEGTLGLGAAGWFNRSNSPRPNTSLGRGSSSQGHSSSSHSGGYGSAMASRRSLIGVPITTSHNTTPSSGDGMGSGSSASASNPYLGLQQPPSAYRPAPRTMTIKLPPDPRSQSSSPGPVSGLPPQQPGSPTSIYSSRHSSLLNPPPPQIQMTMADSSSAPVSTGPYGGTFGSGFVPPMDPSPALTDPGDYIPEGLLHPSLSQLQKPGPARKPSFAWSDEHEGVTYGHGEGSSESSSRGLSPSPRRPGFGMTGIEGSKRSFLDAVDYSRPISGGGVSRRPSWMRSESDVIDDAQEDREEEEEADDEHEDEGRQQEGENDDNIHEQTHPTQETLDRQHHLDTRNSETGGNSRPETT